MDPALAAPPREILRLDGISVSLSGRQILDDVSFSINAGEFTGVIGTNGAGKTTLLRVILGLQRPSSGSIEMQPGARSRRTRSIGYVPQKVLLDADLPMRAWDLVALGFDGNRFGVPLRSKRRAAAVDEMLHAVDAERFAGVRVGHLSGGEQQRVLIAHALVSRPELLLLDEPLANLDLHSSQEIVALLGRVAREQQVSVLLSAHELNPLLPVMDRVVYIAGGKAVSGTADEVIRGDVLSRLYGHHVDVVRVHGRVLVVAGDENENTMAHEADLVVDAAD
jgi:zinc/manganese transport system ATP-binding protein